MHAALNVTFCQNSSAAISCSWFTYRTCAFNTCRNETMEPPCTEQQLSTVAFSITSAVLIRWSVINAFMVMLWQKVCADLKHEKSSLFIFNQSRCSSTLTGINVGMQTSLRCLLPTVFGLFKNVTLETKVAREHSSSRTFLAEDSGPTDFTILGIFPRSRNHNT